METVAPSRKIGLIGGLALRAGIFYYEQIAQHYRAAGLQPLHLVLAHADIDKVLGYVAAGDKPELGRYLATLADELIDAGADLVAISAVAPHLAFAEAQRLTRGTLVNLLDAIPSALTAAGLRRVAVFGNRAVIESRIYGSIPMDVAVTLPSSLVGEIHATYSRIALEGKQGTEIETQFLADAASRLISDSGAEAIVLAGTDLSSFYAATPPSFPHLDVARLHIDRIVQLAR